MLNEPVAACAETDREIDVPPSEPHSLAIESFLPIVQTIVDILADDVDHPEVWQALAKAAKHDVADLRALLARLGPMQTGSARKAIDIIGGVVHALSVDREQGLASLHALLPAHPHCPQVAGAIFFIGRHGQPGPSADLTGRFCDAPFRKFETLMDGTVAPCCSIWTQQRLGHLDTQTAEEIWNSPDAQAMRASIHDGSYRYCNKLRCSFIIDDALPKAKAITDPAMRHVIDEEQIELDTGPSWMFLAHDVTCNLSCPSCRDRILAANAEQEARFDIIERDVLRPLLNGAGPVDLALSGQGDPWSSPHYRSILRYLADHDLDVALELHTNALLMNEGRWADYAGLEKYRALVNVSIDACTPWVFEVVRRPGNWAKLLPNLHFIAAKRAREEFRAFHINATIQLDNFHELGSLISFGATLGVDSVRLYMIQNTGGHLAEDYTRKNVADENHPLHLAFLETLRDPRLALPTAHLYDVANWRLRSLATMLPSDSLPTDWTREDLDSALREATGRPEIIVALCAAGRIGFPDDLDLPICEARALVALGFTAQARYRMKERLALGGDDIDIGSAIMAH